MATQDHSISFSSSISGIDGESLLDKEPSFMPSYEHPKLVEIKGNTGLPHCQPSTIQLLLACVSLDDMDLVA